MAAESADYRLTLREILLEIENHHKENPTHGMDCACLDTYIGQVRRLTSVRDRGAQRRIDYVLRMACEHRTYQE